MDKRYGNCTSLDDIGLASENIIEKMSKRFGDASNAEKFWVVTVKNNTIIRNLSNANDVVLVVKNNSTYNVGVILGTSYTSTVCLIYDKLITEKDVHELKKALRENEKFSTSLEAFFEEYSKGKVLYKEIDGKLLEVRVPQVDLYNENTYRGSNSIAGGYNLYIRADSLGIIATKSKETDYFESEKAYYLYKSSSNQARIEFIIKAISDKSEIVFLKSQIRDSVDSLYEDNHTANTVAGIKNYEINIYRDEIKLLAAELDNLVKENERLKNEYDF